ncbi:acetylcholinesterase precursor [Venturia nashicola]|uniref:Carboxylic ester hydrolase n=1 Tax=Venturia nashicola TaxID=86259 RepID=A0A4Z1P1N8_9PEZI|nr:acetylcholinesterase precursor [Venturia nashicola]TLD34753.1 acetylcholinesterase precursor [Venturia nashicola]
MRIVSFYSVSLSLLVVTISAALQEQWTVGQEVSTTSGKVKGRSATRAGYQEVSEYVGIPFAHPPQGALRWAPPKPFKSDGPIDATKWKSDCSQPTGAGGPMQASPALKAYGDGMGGANHTYTEDCLGINIWTKPQTGEKAKAVLFWVHGGGFSSGNANAPFMDGSRYANDEDVVLVSIQYRLNILGFPNAPGLSDLNLGLLDIRLAVEWVRDNIAKFGGDPKRITIFGESAGGGAVDMYAYAWTSDPIISGIIAQSGAAGSMPSSGASKTPNSAWYVVSKAMGCGGSEAGEKTVECMRGKPADAIMKELDRQTTGPGITPFGPTPDGKIVFKDIGARGDKGEFIKVPLLVGNTDHESGLTTAIAAAAGGKNPFASTGSGPGAAMMGGTNGSSSSLTSALAAILPKDFNPANIMDSLMSCGSATAAGVRIKHNIPAWRYRYHGDFNNTSLGPGTGAYHSSDIPAVFGTTELRPGIDKDSPEEAKMIKETMHAWASFAKDTANGLTSLGWPVYNVKKDTLIRIGYNNQAGLNLAPATHYDQVCGAMKSLMGAMGL